MIKIHREGHRILIQFLLGLTAIYLLARFTVDIIWIQNLVLVACLMVYLLVLQFFRNPKRTTKAAENEIIAPADGKIVAIEEIEEPEYFKGKRVQISIFMSPINVHVNRYPISGTIKYSKYHSGAYLVAWHPKSSTLNERTSVVIEALNGQEVMYKQIAGALARRIINYAKEGEKALVGKDSGFIRFGSRVDIILPLDAEILVKEGQKARGGEQKLAKLTN